MISNHFPMTYGHSFNWAVLAAISFLGAGIRHWFNLRSKGHLNVWILPAATVGMLALAFVIRPQTSTSVALEAGADPVKYAQVAEIFEARCVTCHATVPTFAGVAAPPQGLVLTDPAQAQGAAAKIKSQAVDSVIMPPGNITKITDEERAILGSWIAAGPID